MTELIQGLLVVSIYRLLTCIIGFGVIYFGYKLFVVGVFRNAGDFKAAWGEQGLVLKQAAPGTFFALFGALIVSLSMWKGVESSRHSLQGHQPEQPAEETDLVDEVKLTPSALRASPSNHPRALTDRLIVKHPERYDVLRKVSQGDELSAPERKIVKQWVEEEFLLFTAFNPDGYSDITAWLPGAEDEPLLDQY